MGRKAIILCLLVALLCDISTGFWRIYRPHRRCPEGFLRVYGRRRCRKPSILMRPTTKILLPATTPRAILNPVMLHSSGLPYCMPRDVNAVLQPAERRTKRAVSWPYECRYASILEQSAGDYQFIWPIYDCCSKCSFPQFTTCVADSTRGNSPEWLCPSKGLHCIVGCVNKHNPAAKIPTSGLIKPVIQPSIVKPDGLKPQPKPDGGKPAKPVLNKCEKLEMENGKQCVRKLCVPLKFKP